MVASEPHLVTDLMKSGGTLLAEFAGVGNVAGVRNLIECGISPASVFEQGDPYFDTAANSTAPRQYQAGP